jgi:hypothetical protein
MYEQKRGPLFFVVMRTDGHGPSDWWSGAYLKGLTILRDLRRRETFDGLYI